MPSKTTRFRFKVPFTNPVYFDRVSQNGSEYRVWHDSLANEQYRDYTQRWGLSDRLSLQFSWDGIPQSNSLSIELRFYVNGNLRRTISRTIGGALFQGDMYSDFIAQRRVGNSTAMNGCYCFSQIIGEIEDGDGEAMLHDGDCLMIEVQDPTGAVWRSGRMIVTGDLKGTKLLHYSNISALMQNEYDTYFGYMPFGYDLRIEADFHEQTPNNSASVFQDYEGGYELVSALPYETLKLSIGDDGVRIPRYMQRTLNAIMSCSEKSIDGEDFEITGEPLSVERLDGYANDVYSVVIALSQNRFSYSSYGDQSFSAYAERSPEQIGGRQSGTITVFASGGWYVDGESLSESGISLDRVSGGPGTHVIVYDMPKNTEADETKTIVFVSSETGTEIGSTDILSRKTFAGGIGHMSIGDTMSVSSNTKSKI